MARPRPEATTAQDLSGIYLIPVNGGGGRRITIPQRLTWDPAEDSLPAFSPDGKWVYFTSNRSGTHQVWRMPAAGGEARRITQNGANKGLLSPDGSTLYYTRLGEGLFAVPATGFPS